MMTKGFFTPIVELRRKVFKEVASLALHTDSLDEVIKEVDDIPYKIIPGYKPQFRESVFRERAIIAERTRLALGLPLVDQGEHKRLAKAVEKAYSIDKILEPPLVNVIPAACEACPEDQFYVTNNCRNCLAHPCVIVCPVNAVSIVDDRANIDEKCVHCGRCQKACPYEAIVRFDRPCAAACGIDAIESRKDGRAYVNLDRCVVCGMCVVDCPFGAVSDKSEIFQMLLALKAGKKLYAIIAPSFVGQFGPLVSPEQIFKGLEKLGFKEVVEVALGADIASMHEVKILIDRVPKEQPFMGTSCCPSWTMIAKKYFPELYKYISPSHTPMVATARYVKERDLEGKVVFIGPCISKKLEALNKEVRQYVDYVITFEELAGIFVAAGIELTQLSEDVKINYASVGGRGYAISGGVAQAIKRNMELWYPESKIKVMQADSLSECSKVLTLAKNGKLDGHLIEGMACPGGCIGGPGTLLPTKKARQIVTEFAKNAPYKYPYENPFAVRKKEEEAYEEARVKSGKVRHAVEGKNTAKDEDVIKIRNNAEK
ncbi:iron hydrogenase [Anoxybacter fermentans]|uniref:Iron hydrogenase n=1 Tax=Anoxybacter fermentans TaxID=1323375 RepID=A0A3Q9HPP1_9FIRM|nr:4Fe-4S dicluster domain-containing protein [Anoxybacter fermentans]AZR72887.1 iron hydrogenase [Anoxybacter fermentans]